MKFLIIIGCFIWQVSGVLGQEQKENLPVFQKHEQGLQKLSFRIVNDTSETEKAKACFAFIPKLVEALKTEGSFHYPFDSLETVSIIYPADNSFRIFTWQLRKDNGSYRFYGAIQMNTPELKLFPLFDYSDSLVNPVNDVLSNEKWYGALYYGIYDFKNKGKKYYTLFGWDGNDLWSAKKVMDILYFEDGKPKFGAPLIFFPDSIAGRTQNRLILEFRRDASVRLNYSEQQKMIVFDHLVAPEERLFDLKFTFIPDGTYEGFKLKKGRWVYVEKVFTFSIDEFDNPPMPKPLK